MSVYPQLFQFPDGKRDGNRDACTENQQSPQEDESHQEDESPQEEAAAGNRSHVRLAELLGSGRHGMVFLGSQQVNGSERRVAVKVPSDPAGLAGEHQALRRFEHPNIVAMLGGPLPNGALILELCDLGTLADRLSKDTLRIEEVGDLLRSLLAALRHIHDKGWIHGDLSPGNIGLRTDRGPALLDFATARPADGSPVEEGTAEFAGPLRQADPRLDIRSLAATALRSLGEPDRWDHRKRHIQGLLSEVIARCDAGVSIDLDDLTNVASAITTTRPPGEARAGWSGDGPSVHSPTRAFGPRPTSEPDTMEEPSSGRARRFAVALSLLLLLGATIIEFGSASDVDSAGGPQAAKSATPVLTRELPAAATLEHAGAEWNFETGVVAIAGNADERRYFAAGQPGDIAAIADWSCNGAETLGLYRPSTGGWFVYESWDVGALATVQRLDVGSTLSVSENERGCATPRVG